MATFLAEVYLSRAGAGELRNTALRARSAAESMTGEGTPIRYLRVIFLGDEETCFHVYEEASRRAAIRVERVIAALDVDLSTAPDGAPLPKED
jgi:hypothetical protein